MPGWMKPLFATEVYSFNAKKLYLILKALNKFFKNK